MPPDSMVGWLSTPALEATPPEAMSRLKVLPPEETT
jgi:hypothetical protein